jgi:hypothetical protein
VCSLHAHYFYSCNNRILLKYSLYLIHKDSFHIGTTSECGPWNPCLSRWHDQQHWDSELLVTRPLATPHNCQEIQVPRKVCLHTCTKVTLLIWLSYSHWEQSPMLPLLYCEEKQKRTFSSILFKKKKPRSAILNRHVKARRQCQ